MIRTLIIFVFMAACGAPQPTIIPQSPSVPEASELSEGPLRLPVGDRLPSGVRPTSYAVSLNLDPTTSNYSGRLEIDISIDAARTVIWLNSRGHVIREASLFDGRKRIVLSPMRLEPDWLALTSNKPLEAGQYKLLMAFEGEMDEPLFGMYRVQHDDRWYIYTQFEPLGARQAFPCFDEPQFKTPFTVSVESPSENMVFANAPETNRVETAQSTTRFNFAPTPAMPTYLFALAIGPLDVAHDPDFDLKRADSTTLPIRILTTHGQAHKARFALEHAGKVLALEEAYFGQPYPFAKLDLVAVPDFGAGAMENSGLITYRDRFLLLDEKDASQGERHSYFSIHAHELAHMWFGNLVTMAWWDDLWLNEAFATWLARKMMIEYAPDAQSRIRAIGGRSWVMDQDSRVASRRIREPIENRGDIENAFDGITYTKGAAVLDMFENFVGSDGFRLGIQAYLKKHEWKNATFDDLLNAIEKSAKKGGLKSAMATFIDQAGVPNVQVIPGKCTSSGRPIALKQSRWDPLGGAPLTTGLWHVPLCIRGLENEQRVCTLLSKKEDAIILPGCPKSILPNDGQGGYVVWSMPPEYMDRLADKLQTLSEYEQVNLLANLKKLYGSGALELSKLFRLAEGLMASQSDRIRLSALDLILGLGELVPPDAKAKWDAYLDGFIGPIEDTLVWTGAKNDSKVRWDLRRRVLRIAGNRGHRPEIIKKARQVSDDFLAGHPVNREILSTALSIDAEHGDQTRFERFFEALTAETDPRRRGPLLTGIARFRFDGFTQLVMARAHHPNLRANERGRLIWAASSDPRTRDAAWRHLKANFSSITEALPRNSARYLPYFPISKCEAGLETQLDALFAPFLSGDNAIEGLDRHLANSKDQLSQCVEKRKHYGKTFRRLISKGAP